MSLKSLSEQQITFSEDVTETRILLTVLRTPSRSKKEESNKIKNERGDIMTDITDTMTMRDCYEQLYGNKVDNLEET